MGKKKHPGALPAADDWSARFDAARRSYMVETKDGCDRCVVKFVTGDVCFIYGDLDNAAARKLQMCDACGYAELVKHGGRSVPAATLLYIEEADRDVDLSWLTAEKIRMVKEAFGIIDRIHDHVAGPAARYGELAVQPPSEQEPS